MLTYNFYKTNKEIKADVSDCMRDSWKSASVATLVYCLICLVLIGATTLLSIFVAWWISIPLAIVSYYIISILNYGYTNMSLQLSRQQVISTKDLFVGFSKKIGQILALSTKKFFMLLFWLVMLIVPFFIKLIEYSMATYLVIDRADVTSENALKESRHIMKQNRSRYLKFLLSYILWYLLVVISAGVAFIWVAPKVMTAKAVFYENLKTEF